MLLIRSINELIRTLPSIMARSLARAEGSIGNMHARLWPSMRSMRSMKVITHHHHSSLGKTGLILARDAETISINEQ